MPLLIVLPAALPTQRPALELHACAPGAVCAPNLGHSTWASTEPVGSLDRPEHSRGLPLGRVWFSSTQRWQEQTCQERLCNATQQRRPSAAHSSLPKLQPPALVHPWAKLSDT